MTLSFYSRTATHLSGSNPLPAHCLLPSVERFAPLEQPLFPPSESPVSIEPGSAHSLAFTTPADAMPEEDVRSWVVVLAANEKELVRYRQTLAGATYDLEFFTDGHRAFEWMQQAKFLRAVLVLNDLATPGVSVIPLIRQVCTAFPAVAIVLCTVSRPLAVQAFDAGAFAVVREPAPASAFLGTLLRPWQSVPLRHSDLPALPAHSDEVLPPSSPHGGAAPRVSLRPKFAKSWSVSWARLLSFIGALIGRYEHTTNRGEGK
jgi:CheY-like chemotaxis protein